ncbi:MAG: DUF2807 domain-containing protein [Gammaproteobacteria bacterium]|nr:DUF2807 domain-containing protein [Gammaproteobacteria bacterium]
MKKFTTYCITLVAIAALLSACFANAVKGDGNVVAQPRQIQTFDDIAISGDFKVIVTAAAKPSLTIHADSNLLQYIKTPVKKGTLSIYVARNVNLAPTQRLVVDVAAVKPLREISASGNTHFSDRTLHADKLLVRYSGSTEAILGGQVKKLTLRSSGSSNINAKALKAYKADLDLSGTTRLSGHFIDELLIRSSGTTTISYSGYPKVNQTKASGDFRFTQHD